MMAYSNDFVASILVNDKPQREFKEDNIRTCYIPFDSEYKIRLKSKWDRRAQVEVDIDGMDALNGSRICLNPYQTIDLERFLVDLNKGKKLKFLSKKKAISTGEINDPDSPDNGIVLIKFYREKATIVRAMAFTELCSDRISKTDDYVLEPQASSFCCATNEGVTGEGSNSTQAFKSGLTFDVESIPIVIKFKLKGNSRPLLGVYVNQSTSPLHHVSSLEEGMDWIKHNVPNINSIEIK